MCGYIIFAQKHYRVHLAPTPPQLTRREPPRNRCRERATNSLTAQTTKLGHQIDGLAGDGLVVEAGEGVDEGRDEEARVEAEEVAEEGGVGEGERKLREGVGNAEGGGGWAGDEVGEAEETERGVWRWRLEGEGGAVALGARRRVHYCVFHEERERERVQICPRCSDWRELTELPLGFFYFVWSFSKSFIFQM